MLAPTAQMVRGRETDCKNGLSDSKNPSLGLNNWEIETTRNLLSVEQVKGDNGQRIPQKQIQQHLNFYLGGIITYRFK